MSLELHNNNIYTCLLHKVQKLVSQLKQEHSDFKSIVRLVYGSHDVPVASSSVVLSKIEAMFHEKSELVVEIEELQKSVSFHRLISTEYNYHNYDGS